MSLQATARTAFSSIKTAYPESVVAVKIRGVSANGISDTQISESDFTLQGQAGNTSGIVTVDASELAEPDKGETISIAGVSVFTTQIKKDPAGALLRISWQKQRPISGI